MSPAPKRGNNWLTQEQIDCIAESFLAGLSAREAARLVKCSNVTAWKYYHKLQGNEDAQMVAREPRAPRPRKEIKPAVKKPLNNPARFYSSAFVPT